ncbi:MAG: hypothetical protein RIR09_822 [Pseudomonadota bacterium]|jgi:acyl-CoA reductase-like NAD-dependent aldehyde dehydrogenase
MVQRTKFYIDGKWVDPVDPKSHTVINPADRKSNHRRTIMAQVLGITGLQAEPA